MRWLTTILASATAAVFLVVAICGIAASVGGTANPRATGSRLEHPWLTPSYGDPGASVTVVGHGFTAASRIYVAGHPVPTTYKSRTQVSGVIPSSRYAQVDVAVRTGARTTWIGLFTYGKISDIPPMGDTTMPTAPASPSADAAPHSAGMPWLCDGIRSQADANRQARGVATAYATVVVGPAEADPRYPDGTLSTKMRLLRVAQVWVLAGHLDNGPVTYLSEGADDDGLGYTPPGTYSVLLTKGDRPGVYEPAYGVAGTFSQVTDAEAGIQLVERCAPAADVAGVTNPAHLLSLFRTALAKRVSG